MPKLAGLPEAAQIALVADIPFPARLGEPAKFAGTVRCVIGNGYLNGETIRLDAAIRLKPK